MKTPTNTDRLYYYRPLSYFKGERLKCAGHGAERLEHLAFYGQYFGNPRPAEAGHLWGDIYLPEVYILRGHHGDQITLEYAKANAEITVKGGK